MTEFIDLLRVISHRIVGLQVDLYSGNIAPMLTLVTFPIPNLRYLSVSKEFGSSQDYMTVSPKIFDSVDGKGLPLLKKLSLFMVDFPCHPFLYRSLRSLTLRYQHYGAGNRPPTMETFLDILDACSSTLEDIRLAESGPTLSTEIVHYPDPTRSITLPVLKQFYMFMTLMPKDIPHLLAHLILPETIRISLHTTPRRELFSVLPRVQTGLKSLGVIDELTFEPCSRMGELIVKGRASQSSNPSLLIISLRSNGDNDDWGRVAIDSFESLRTLFSSRITIFTFKGCFNDSGPLLSTHWTSHFSYFSNIEVLNLSSRASLDTNQSPPVWSALEEADASAVPVEAATPNNPSPLICHKLRQLSIESSWSGECGISWVLKLYMCLKTRLRHSIPSKLKRLIVRGVGPEWNDELLRDTETNWPSIAKLVDEIEIGEVEEEDKLSMKYISSL